MLKGLVSFLRGRRRPNRKRRSTHIPEAVKFDVLFRQGYRCAMCGRTSRFLEFDHIIPSALGGSNDINNLQALCPECHRNKTKVDRLLISQAKFMSQSKKKLISQTVKRGWLFIGEYPSTASLIPHWLLNSVPNYSYKLNDDGYPYSFIAGRRFEYLIFIYSRKNYLFFKRPRRDKRIKKGRRRRR